MVLFLGECAVYHWLKRQFPSKDIGKAWVSEYRERLLSGSGDDSLGYDFEIRYLGKQWYLEVKTHMGDPREIELGETQVRKARDCARRKTEQYCILYVSNIQDPILLDVEPLPNPLSDVHHDRFKVMGEGLRYRFDRA